MRHEYDNNENPPKSRETMAMEMPNQKPYDIMSIFCLRTIELTSYQIVAERIEFYTLKNVPHSQAFVSICYGMKMVSTHCTWLYEPGNNIPSRTSASTRDSNQI